MIRTYASISVIALYLFGCDPNNYIEPETDTPLLVGKGVFSFQEYAPLANKPINVFYYVPSTATPSSEVVFIIHGNNRNAEDYRDAWVTKAEEYGLVIVAPEFNQALFSGSSNFLLGNVFADGENPSPATLQAEEVRTFALIEPLFDSILTKTGNNSEHYTMFGHSGGGQFLHRFLIFVPHGRYERVVAANAGWYTVPDDAISFPYGLGMTSHNDQSFFERSLIIHIGTLDDNPNSGALRHTEEADAQGMHRYARAHHFYARSQAIADQTTHSFNWLIEDVEGVGHDHEGMSQYAADYLFAR
ncbi:MAG: hypothetical protein VX834_06320 [Myxococcota bacterium]|nr:hypothetical protein [Myxococcota bacterium]